MATKSPGSDKSKALVKAAASVVGGQLGGISALARTVAELVEGLLGEPFRVAGGVLFDQLQVWQWRNRIRIMRRSRDLLAETASTGVAPPSFLLPLLDAAGTVDEPSLQELWAQLLAAGVRTEEARHPMYISTLRQLSSDDAKFFEELVRGVRRIDDWRDRDEKGIAERLLTLNIVAPILATKESVAPGTPNVVLKTVLPSAFGRRFARTVMPDLPAPETAQPNQALQPPSRARGTAAKLRRRSRATRG
jgi:hypothetical protein